MIAKALIVEQIDNKFRVRIPLFESAGNLSECILTATLCYVPGDLDVYRVGDVVFVAFENNQINSPVIIGKLYTGKEETNTKLSQSANLKVTTQAILPGNTKIGEFLPEDVYTALKSSPIYEQRITDLEEKVKVLSEIITEQSKIND